MRVLSRHLIRSALVCLAVLGLASVAQAVPITTLYNTGVDSSHVALPDGTVPDPHYTLVSAPILVSTRVRTSAGGYPMDGGGYIPDSALSAWIGPNYNAALEGPTGLYTYRTTFDLTGLNPLTSAISGGWATNNVGMTILLNGVDIGAPVSTGWTAYTPFFVDTGFVNGLNTLDFVVDNDSGVTAMRVEMTGSASLTGDPNRPPEQMPEPASLVLFGTGIIAAARRFRTKE